MNFPKISKHKCLKNWPRKSTTWCKRKRFGVAALEVDHVVLETIVMIFRPQKVSNSIHRVGNRRKERNSYTVMSDNAFKKRCVFYVEYLTH